MFSGDAKQTKHNLLKKANDVICFGDVRLNYWKVEIQAQGVADILHGVPPCKMTL